MRIDVQYTFWILGPHSSGHEEHCVLDVISYKFCHSAGLLLVACLAPESRS
jgi:hypothetical protein